MTGKSMYGVVLWCDESEQKAVIWCEDHGDLAFYSGGDQSVLEGPALDAGDLIQFDVRQEAHMRLARNPQLVVEDQFPTIAERLGKASGAAKEQRQRTANVIPFSPRRTAATACA